MGLKFFYHNGLNLCYESLYFYELLNWVTSKLIKNLKLDKNISINILLYSSSIFSGQKKWRLSGYTWPQMRMGQVQNFTSNRD